MIWIVNEWEKHGLNHKLFGCSRKLVSPQRNHLFCLRLMSDQLLDVCGAHVGRNQSAAQMQCVSVRSAHAVTYIPFVFTYRTYSVHRRSTTSKWISKWISVSWRNSKRMVVFCSLLRTHITFESCIELLTEQKRYRISNKLNKQVDRSKNKMWKKIN